jgi:rubrerythrin
LTSEEKEREGGYPEKDTPLFSDDLADLLAELERQGSGNRINEALKRIVERRLAATKLGSTILQGASLQGVRKEGEEIWICPKCNVYWIGPKGSKCPECGGK